MKKENWFKKFRRCFLHDILGWGYPETFLGGDKFQLNYSCRFCEKELTQDSNGDYFHLS